MPESPGQQAAREATGRDSASEVYEEPQRYEWTGGYQAARNHQRIIDGTTQMTPGQMAAKGIDQVPEDQWAYVRGVAKDVLKTEREGEEMVERYDRLDPNGELVEPYHHYLKHGGVPGPLGEKWGFDEDNQRVMISDPDPELIEALQQAYEINPEGTNQWLEDHYGTFLQDDE